MAYPEIESERRRRFLRTCVSSTVLLVPAFSQSVLANSPVKSRHAAKVRHEMPDSAIRDAISKARIFEQDYTSDLYIKGEELKRLRSVLSRLIRLQRIVGYGNFGLISFDDALRYAGAYSVIGKFTRTELDFIERIFSEDARLYGFFGEKVSKNLTDKVQRREIIKLRGTGHYLYKIESLAAYQKLRRLIGPDLILTSGIRGIVKQIYLFLAKANRTNGNLSRAARSLAPPGHSFHGVGDFDVGQRGLGGANFTSAFAKTNIYKRMRDLGFTCERYPDKNLYGVRYEPWHIKVIKHA